MNPSTFTKASKEPIVNFTKNKNTGFIMNIITLGIDLAKSVFQLHGINLEGEAIFKKKLPRSELLKLLAQLTPCTIILEACSSANYWARQFKDLGIGLS